jgi:hypothetical protein
VLATAALVVVALLVAAAELAVVVGLELLELEPQPASAERATPCSWDHPPEMTRNLGHHGMKRRVRP